MCSSITDKEIVLSIYVEISDDEINELQDQQEHKKVVKKSKKAVDLPQRFLKTSKNLKTEAFDAIAMLEKTVQMQKGFRRWLISVKDIFFCNN